MKKLNTEKKNVHGVEIEIANKPRDTYYLTFSYKGMTYLRTFKPIYGSIQTNGKWHGIGRGGYEYVIMDGSNNGKVKIFYSLKDVRLYISTHVRLMEAQKAMADLVSEAVMA